MAPAVKAWLAVSVFSLIGLGTLFFRAPHGPTLVPHVFFFAVLIINTFYSIRFYADIQPDDLAQKVIDGGLVLCYFALALSLGNAVAFAFWALALFTTAAPKYVFMLGAVPYLKLLRKKALLDSLGALSCLLLLGFTLLGFPVLSACVFAILFAVANVYLLVIRPMYRL